MGPSGQRTAGSFVPGFCGLDGGGPAAHCSGMTFLRGLLNLNPWVYLLSAGFAEMGFTSFMKLSNGFQRWTYNVLFAVCALLSFGLLNLSTRSLSLGTA